VEVDAESHAKRNAIATCVSIDFFEGKAIVIIP
jgi:hypothetical protein